MRALLSIFSHAAAAELLQETVEKIAVFAESYRPPIQKSKSAASQTTQLASEKHLLATLHGGFVAYRNTFAPTVAPTSVPSTAPSMYPTTPFPTSQPSHAPTSFPTAFPTFAATVQNHQSKDHWSKRKCRWASHVQCTALLLQHAHSFLCM